MSDGTEPPWFSRIHSASTSWTRFRVLALAANDRVTAASAARSLGCDPKAAGKHLSSLQEQGLLRAHEDGGFAITADGEATHALLATADQHPAAALVGRRLLGVRYDVASPRDLLRAALAGDAEMVLRADGDLDLVAVLPDDPDLIADLEQRIRDSVALTVRVRIGNVRAPSADST
jgi:hypothetical protein